MLDTLSLSLSQLCANHIQTILCMYWNFFWLFNIAIDPKNPISVRSYSQSPFPHGSSTVCAKKDTKHTIKMLKISLTDSIIYFSNLIS